MNKRFCKLGRIATKAFFLFAMCGATYSCSDDYMWDDSDPTWLGSSIYEYLESQGNYKNFVKLIDDLDYKEVLARTGSKTLFVADDDAFDTFFKSNPWGVHSYDQLTASQKKLILNSAMINNAYLLEMMSSIAASSGDDNAIPEKGQCLRRETAADVTDSIPHLFAGDLPVNYSALQENSQEKDYWEKFRKSDKGIYLVLDGTSPMMTHFLPSQMSNKHITDKDFSIIVGREREKNDAFIFDCKVIEQDITCQNGYVNKLDRVLLPPQNMAEELRTNGKTKIFSHLIDRFSAPFYSSRLTERARLLYGNQIEEVYEKRYFAARSQGNNSLYSDNGVDPNIEGSVIFNGTSNPALPFDPGWNSYQSNAEMAKEQDMGAIFAPADNNMLEYFFSENGGGHFLIKAYAPDYLSKIKANTTNMELVYEAIDQIPREITQKLVANLMKESFTSSVPSKFMSIKNSAQDAMFDSLYNYHNDKIDEVIIANNGVIYIMDEVITPADYAAVSAPALVEKDKHIINWAIQQDKLNNIYTTFKAYLLAMQSRFSFFAPQDNGFWYIDPVSFSDADRMDDGTLKARAYEYTWDETKKNPIAKAYYYLYNPKDGTGTIGDVIGNVDNAVMENRLKDILETHTIIHEDNTETTGINEMVTGAECVSHYFLTKNNSVIYIDGAAKRKNGMTVKGGWMLSNNMATDGTSNISENKIIGFDDKSAQSNGYGNGFAYMVDQPIIPTIENVYSALYKNPNFSKFLSLLNTDDNVLKELGITGSDQNKYRIFTATNHGLPCYDSDGKPVNRATNVRFFNNFRYTIWVPTNKAIDEAIEKGLPTWESIAELLELDVPDEEKTELSPEETKARNEKALAMATSIINFVKYHFMDNSVFADVPAYKETQYETSTMENDIYCKLSVKSSGNGNITVKDMNGNERKVTADKNIVVRDYVLSGSTSKSTITSSSSAVLHGIDGVLNYKELTNGRYDSDWANAAKARAYLNKYKLRK